MSEPPTPNRSTCPASTRNFPPRRGGITRMPPCPPPTGRCSTSPWISRPPRTSTRARRGPSPGCQIRRHCHPPDRTHRLVQLHQPRDRCPGCRKVRLMRGVVAHCWERFFSILGATVRDGRGYGSWTGSVWGVDQCERPWKKKNGGVPAADRRPSVCD